ncbi:MAG: phage holin family protein [Leptolyngbya sp. SIO4C1]|nr:phage holin family protein [Leptolyngbya sp. SIO4C1]
MWLVPFLITWIVTIVSFIIIAKFRLGVESASTEKSVMAGIVFGLLNAIVSLPIISGIFWLFSLFGLLGNIILFGLAAWLVEGFRLRWGIIGAIIGAFALTIINSILFWILRSIGLYA